MFQPVVTSVPDAFEIVGPDPAYTIRIPVAVSDDGFRTVTLDVRLIPKFWNGVDVHELKFLYVLRQA